MSNVPANLKYSEQHEWVKMDGDIATIGITDHAQDALGDLVFVELPEIGRTIKKDEEFIVVESVKAASEVYAPIDGEVIEVNETLNDTPESVNDAPYEGGWLCKIRVSDSSQLDGLLDADKYTALIG